MPITRKMETFTQKEKEIPPRNLDNTHNLSATSLDDIYQLSTGRKTEGRYVVSLPRHVITIETNNK